MPKFIVIFWENNIDMLHRRVTKMTVTIKFDLLDFHFIYFFY